MKLGKLQILLWSDVEDLHAVDQGKGLRAFVTMVGVEDFVKVQLLSILYTTKQL